MIGAGVVGVATAYHLAQQGHQVLVLDQASTPAAMCSFANAGIIAVGHASSWAGPAAPRQLLRAVLGQEPSVKLSRCMDADMWRWGLKFLRNCTTISHRRNSDAMAMLSRHGRDALQQMEAKVGLTFDQSHDGVYYLYTSSTQYAARLKGNTGADTGFTPHDAATLMKLDPALRAFDGRLQGGLISSVDSKGDCQKFTTGLVEWLTAKGNVSFHFGTTVTGFASRGMDVSAVLTDKGRFACDHVVIAAGTETPKLTASFGVRPLIYPVKGYSATYPILDASRIPVRPFIDETSLLAVTRLGDRLRVTAIAEFAGYDRTVTADRVAYLDTYVDQHFSGAVDVAQAEHWAGLRPTTPSGRPYLGRLRQTSNVWLNAGHGQLGWTMAAGAGEIMAAMISGNPNNAAQVSETAHWLTAS
ncbi:D-amino-acid dehydrogenase [Ruegeria halocynthiae]|uniref:D-amino-acid dehydrogenase n=1 Tax=Ruegeria halocynthiae TaxID=985054 RepID=A0A1H3G2B8_9RHOB|nr:D-amino-acid dehydrogenase [Ruegeria halocynthiae]